MKFRCALIVVGLVVVTGVAGAVVAQAKIAARDALYARPASAGPDEILGGVAYSAAPWPTLLTVSVVVSALGAIGLVILAATRAAGRGRQSRRA